MKARNTNEMKLDVMYTNIDCITNKKAEFLAIIDETHPDIIVTTETKPKNPRFHMTKTDLHVDGYNLFTNVEEEGVRGIAVHTKNDLNVMEPNTVLLQDSASEVQPIEIKLRNNDKLLLIAVYRSPNSTPENNEKINTLIRNINTLGYSHILIVGDFNHPEIQWSEGAGNTQSNKNEAFKFLEATNDAYLYQHICEATRHQLRQESNVLDLLLTNEGDMISDLIMRPPIGKSDHVVLNFKINCYANRTQYKNETCQYNKGDYDKMREELSLDWQEILGKLNVEDCWEVFSGKVAESANRNVPKVSSRKKKRKLSWRDREVNKKMNKKQKLWKKYCESRTKEDYIKYTRARNQVRWATRKAVKTYEKEKARNIKGNAKIFWKYVNSKSKVRQGIPDLEDGSSVAQSDTEKAELLNKFFVSTFTKEDLQHIPIPTERHYNEEITDIDICFEEVQQRLKNLNPNKAMGPDNVHPRVLKELADTLAVPLQILYVKTVQEGKLPDAWKTANVTPIYKKGCKKSPGNYRPVSLTSVVGKILEGLIRDAIVKHMKVNNLFTPHQHGFLPGRSTTTQMLECLDEWTEWLDRGTPVDAVYLDFRKAFDSVPIKRLLAKIQSYGITGNLLNWIESFLSGRRQRVCVNGEKSEWAEVTSGVPQGSVLGPVLFTIFVNDMPEIVQSKLKLFADDTKLYRSVVQREECNKLQRDLQVLQDWAIKWQLSFHPMKCTVIRLGKGHPDYTYSMLDNETRTLLEFTQQEKDLGITVDKELSFSKHISNICNKANQIAGLIWRTFAYVDKEVFLLLYKSLIRPQLEYGAPAWSPYTWKLALDLERVQKRATKRVPGLRSLPYEERLKALNLPTLVYRRLRGDLINTYKFLHGIYDTSCPFELNTSTRTRGHCLRIKRQASKSNRRSHFFCIRVVSWWNNLPEPVVTSPSVNCFKERLDNHMKKHSVYYNFRALDDPQLPGMSVT